MPVVFSQVVFSLLEVEAVSLVAVHEYGEGGLPAPRYSVVFGVVLNVKIGSAPDFTVPDMTFPCERGDGVTSGLALRSLLQRHQVIDVGHEIIDQLALHLIDLLQHQLRKGLFGELRQKEAKFFPDFSNMPAQ